MRFSVKRESELMSLNIAPAAMTSLLWRPSHRRGASQSLPEDGATKSNTGFTLIELVVVIAIVGLMSTMAVVSFKGILTKQRAEGVVQDVTIALRMAHQTSVFQQEKQDIVFNFKKSSYHREFLAEGKHSRRKRVTEGEYTTLPRPFEILFVYFPENDKVSYRRNARISFHPDGTSTDSVIMLGKEDRESIDGYSDIAVIEVRGSDSKVSLVEDEFEKAAYLGML